MKYKDFLFCSLVLFSLTFFVSCSNDEPIIPEVNVSQGVTDYFIESMDFDAKGGIKILNFTSNVDWTLSVSDSQNSVDWCTVSQTEGAAGSYGLAVVVQENDGYDDRNVVMVFKAGNITRSVVVNQKQKNALTLTTNRFEIGNEGGNIDVEVKSNIGYKVEIPERCQNWISQSSKTRALSTNHLSFAIAKSTEYDKREGEIVFSSNDVSEVIKVYQSGSAILVLSQNEYNVGSDGGVVSIEISSNFDFKVDMPNVDWIENVDKTRAVSSHTIFYEVFPNTTYDNREAVIIFKDANSDRRESVTIRQKQKDAILLSNDKVEIAQDGGMFSVDVNSNVDYEMEIPSSCSNWLSKASVPSPDTRTLSKSTLSFNALKSEEYDKREGEIYFRYNDIIDTLHVYQSGGAILVLNQDSYNLEGVATTISVQLKSNIDYTITTSNDWIEEVSTRAVSSSTKNFKIATNKTGKSRTGNITFTSADGARSAKVVIVQATVVDAKSLTINFTNTSDTMGDNLYIGKKYEFNVSCTPSNADVSYKWTVDNPDIASISGNGKNATLSTKNFGQSTVIVTDVNSGVSARYDFGTCVTDFKFTETSRETQYGYPVVTIAIDGSHQLKYSCNPSYATNVFRDLKAFNFKELSGGTYVIVDESSIVDIDENGLMTAKKIGSTIINANNGNGIYKNGDCDGIFVNVVQEITPYGSIGGHRYVDLALPSGKLWATENFGALNETDYGSYYMWSSSDRVPSSWGAKWNTPTSSEFKELLDNCSYEWSTKNGVNGYTFTGSNGATLFLPAAGFKIYYEGYGYSDAQSLGSQVYYWTSTSSSYDWEGHSFAYVLFGSSTSLSANTTYNTSLVVCPIRPISR